MRIIVSTDNVNKLREIRELLGDDVELLTKSDAGYGDVHPIEDGETLEENALIKVESIEGDEGDVVIGDDTGLFVNALDGRPGVHSARYAGEEHDDAANRALLLKEMEDTIDRSAYFKTVIAVKRGDAVYTVEGVCPGQILMGEKGENGFGYDPLFVPEGYDETFAEMTEEEKNKISHRGRALRAFIDSLELK
ncbi:MAG: RdgB/HAM1 family non-canonical purine NTP pyrophosphatase [Peptoniphilus sp.]|nr:RdgB/HAM1 family non-canonical purine NTP pyrophosphatase [Peptoniphilus sp.]MDD7363866.1 RdgB/HAM1 family non-canonical purine NTP pyrophosphatase [Bacillota bacterium]MDY6044295.1 RdgB/HAM1 family non-canonical purine NTP pyrophosphatase [Peptoniphilus sp.]